jgi:hypothetical protein
MLSGLLFQIQQWVFFFLIKSSACSITVSNTTCCCNHTILLLLFICICLLEWFNFSRSIEFTYLVNCFKYLLVSSLLLTGQLPTLSTLVFSFSLSFFSLLHWNIRWSTVCVPCLHGHSGLPIIFNRCKYDRIFPWPVVIVVTFGLKVKFTAVGVLQQFIRWYKRVIFVIWQASVSKQNGVLQ